MSGNYRQTSLPHSDSYARARHVGTKDGRWTSTDPLWPYQPAFLYCLAGPTVWIDPSGLSCAESSPPVETDPDPPLRLEQGGGLGSTVPRGSGPSAPPYNGGYYGPTGEVYSAVFSLGQAVGRALHPSPSPSPVGRLRLLPNCPAMNQKMHAMCDQPQSGCSKVPASNCGELGRRFTIRDLCRLMRTEILLECDYDFQIPMNWAPNACMHEMAMCQAENSMCACVSKGAGCTPPVGSSATCAQALSRVTRCTKHACQLVRQKAPSKAGGRVRSHD